MDFNKMREQIEFRYGEALRAVDTLQAFMQQGNHTNETVPLPQESPPEKCVPASRKPRAPLGSVRDKVLAAVGAEWTPISDIATVVDLTPRQVAAVLYASNVRGRVETRGRGANRECRLRPGESVPEPVATPAAETQDDS